jgi:uncharacterized membrane protein (DUF485 family)
MEDNMVSGGPGRVLDSAEFKELVSKRWAMSLALTLAIFIGYFGFILVLAFDKTLLARKIGEHVTIGIPIGIGVIVLAWILTGIYVWWANGYYDRTVEQMKHRVRGGG